MTALESPVVAAWKRLEAWYEAHDISDYLLPGATPGEIEALKEIIGQPLPVEFQEFLSRHNGSVDSGWPHGDLLSTERIAETWQLLTGLLAGGDFDQSKPHVSKSRFVQLTWWNQNWIPIDDDYGGNHHVVDLSPAEAGTEGQVFFWDHGAGPNAPDASSISDFLCLALERLEEEEREGEFYKIAYPR